MDKASMGTPLEVVDFLNLQKIKTIINGWIGVFPNIRYDDSSINTYAVIILGCYLEGKINILISVESNGIGIKGKIPMREKLHILRVLEGCYTGMERREMRDGMETVG